MKKNILIANCLVFLIGCDLPNVENSSAKLIEGEVIMEDFDFNQYYQNHQVDISWLEKPSQHEFRWRCIDGSWRKSKRRVSSIETFRKSINQDNPTDIYFSTSFRHI